jgi:hypothetical protein
VPVVWPIHPWVATKHGICAAAVVPASLKAMGKLLLLRRSVFNNAIRKVV